MFQTTMVIILIILAAYIALGVLFVVPFQLKGLQKIDEGIHGSTIGFRIIIIPGCILLWPVLLQKWVHTTKTNSLGQGEKPRKDHQTQ